MARWRVRQQSPRATFRGGTCFKASSWLLYGELPGGVGSGQGTRRPIGKLVKYSDTRQWRGVPSEEVMLSDGNLNVFWRQSQEDFLTDWMSAVGFPMSFPQGQYGVTLSNLRMAQIIFWFGLGYQWGCWEKKNYGVSVFLPGISEVLSWISARGTVLFLCLWK